jgi:hypothetical protein
MVKGAVEKADTSHDEISGKKAKSTPMKNLPHTDRNVLAQACRERIIELTFAARRRKYSQFCL